MGQEADIGPKNGRQVSEKRMRNELRGAAAVESQQVWSNVKQNEAIKESFDLICRELQIGEREAAFYFVDGMIKDEAMVKILGQLLGITKEKMPEDATGFSRCCMPYVEVDIYDDFDTVVRNVLSGAIALFIDGYEACIVLDCRTYPARWRSPLRISLCAAPETALWRRSYLTRH